VVLVTTISPTKAQTEMIVYTFLLPGKNEKKVSGLFRGFGNDPRQIRNRCHQILTAFITKIPS
jgi:hypothetical protein